MRNFTLIALATAASILTSSAFAVEISPDRPLSSLEYREQKRDQFNELMFGTTKGYFCSLELEQQEKLMRQALAIATRIDPRIKETVENVLQETEASGQFKRKGRESAMIAYACNSDLAKPMGKFPE